MSRATMCTRYANIRRIEYDRPQASCYGLLFVNPQTSVAVPNVVAAASHENWNPTVSTYALLSQLVHLKSKANLPHIRPLLSLSTQCAVPALSTLSFSLSLCPKQGMLAIGIRETRGMAVPKSPRHQAFSQYFKQLCQKKGYSLTKLAEVSGIRYTSIKKYAEGQNIPQSKHLRTLTRILGENIVQQVDKQLSSAVSVSYPAASPETDVFGRKPDAQQMDKLFQDIQGTYASLYSISADIEGEFITKNVWIFDGFLPDQGVITGTFTSGIKKNTPLRMYVSHDRQTFYTLVFDGNDVIYDIVILHPLQLSTEIVIFYGISMGEATQDRFSIIGGKILLLPESKKSKMLPRRLGKSQLSDVVWNRLYSYFWDFGAGGSYIRAEPHWQTRKLGHDGVERLVDTGLPALMEEMLKHW